METGNFTADAQLMLDQMRRRKELCGSFTFHFEVDAEDRLKRLFWCDPISRRNYHMFGDIVAFDATYPVTKYCMIFAIFAGKDNHGRPVTFAAGLLSKEDSDSFMWLFDKFIGCMRMPPKMIITDPDLGLRATIEKVFPGTRHRWCLWHTILNLSDKVPRKLLADVEFKKQLNTRVLSELLEPRDFENAWNDIMARFGLSDVSWFKKMFEEREFWVPAYFRDFPRGSIITITSIYESEEDNFYKNYAKSQSNLLEFMMNFNNALDSQRRRCFKLDCSDEFQSPYMETKLLIEKHAASIYTANMFEKVQEEITSACFSCRLVDISVDDVRETYKIVDTHENNAFVQYISSNDEYVCSCKLISRHGYLCSHIFSVLKNKGVESIPAKYIHSRWAKTSIYEPVFDVSDEESKRYEDDEDNQRLYNQIVTDFYGLMHKIGRDYGKMSSFLFRLNDLGRLVTGMESAESSSTKRKDRGERE